MVTHNDTSTSPRVTPESDLGADLGGDGSDNTSGTLKQRFRDLRVGRDGYITRLIVGQNKLVTGGGTAKLQVAGDGYFSGTVNANKFVGDGSGLTGISGGIPSGDYTHNGKITATDFISTSDERLKDNITPIPVGLIDDIKPVSWEWKDGSGTSAGVVAQQLQSAGLGDYVHENEDGQLGVNYQALTAILLAEVINLKAEVEALR
jgi:hypothetical protein